MNWIFLDVLSDMNQLWTSLFYGNGAWLGLLIMLTLLIGLTFMWKYAGLLMLPVAVLMGITYLDNGLGWEGLIMFLATPFIMLAVVKKKG